MIERRHLLAAAVMAALASGAAAQNPSGSEARQDAERSGSPPAAPMIVLVPVAIAQAEDFGDGCWARLYDGQNFRGNELSLIGPVDMANMRTSFGTDWGGEFDSVRTGPKATVTVYDNENYRDKSATIQPNREVADLDEKLGFFQDIRSLKIACSTGTAEGKSGKQQASGRK